MVMMEWRYTPCFSNAVMNNRHVLSCCVFRLRCKDSVEERADTHRSMNLASASVFFSIRGQFPILLKCKLGALELSKSYG